MVLMATVTLYTCESGQDIFNQNDWFFAWASPWEHRNIPFTVDTRYIEEMGYDNDIQSYKVKIGADCNFNPIQSNRIRLWTSDSGRDLFVLDESFYAWDDMGRGCTNVFTVDRQYVTATTDYQGRPVYEVSEQARILWGDESVESNNQSLTGFLGELDNMLKTIKDKGVC
jgi:hypothetical protein